jgi:class 3 adenylate cyclase
MSTPPQLPENYRVWLANVRQALLAATENLLEMAHLFDEDARRLATPGEFQSDAQAISRNGDELFKRINGLLDGALDTQGHAFDEPAQFERFVRHELRSPANRIIQRCEILVEEIDAHLPGQLLTEIDQIKNKAWQVVKSIDQVATFSNPEATAENKIIPFHIDIFEGITRLEKNQPGNVLVVDDNEDNRDIFRRKLKREGHTVFTANSGTEAIEMIEAAPHQYDVLLLDVIMPGMNGIQVLQYLKSHATLSHIPIVMISALDAIDSVVRCIEMGAEDYLPKTCDPVLLRARIGASLEKKRLRERETELLHAVLPSKLVAEYRESKKIVPRRHERIGVLFLDIVGFTTWSEEHTPEEVVEFLEKMITSFEKILEEFPIEKIKTIGDAFMCTSGLLSESPHPVKSLVEAGLKMIDAAKREANFNIRVGIHVGPVVAGKLGHRQFTFDLWGATVNIASRMESNGIPGRITMTPTAWNDIAAEAEATPREVKVKGLSEAMTVWDFVRFVQ